MPGSARWMTMHSLNLEPMLLSKPMPQLEQELTPALTPYLNIDNGSCKEMGSRSRALMARFARLWLHETLGRANYKLQVP